MNHFQEEFFHSEAIESPFNPSEANLKFEGPFLEKGETLVCFGDSLTAAKPGYIEFLTEYLEGRGVHVIQAGRGGDKTPWALTRLEADVISRKPDAVLIFLGTNDAAIGRNLWANEPVVSPLTYKENLIWIAHLSKIYGEVKKISICTPSGRWEGSTYLRHGDNLSAYCAMAREAADAIGARLVPWDAVFNEYWRKNSSEAGADGLLLTKDGTHLTDYGYRLLAKTMLNAWRMDQ